MLVTYFHLFQIQQDFRILYPEVADKLFLEWPKIAPLVLKYADLNNPTWQEALTVPHLRKNKKKITNTFLIE